jgi:hypothetical protein
MALLLKAAGIGGTAQHLDGLTPRDAPHRSLNLGA